MEKDFQYNKELSKYSKELAEDIKLSNTNLREKSLMASSIWAKWLSYLMLEKENLYKLSLAKQKIINKKLSVKSDNSSVLRLKNESAIVENDETIKKIADLTRQTNDSIDFIERALNIISNFGFNIKNSIEIIKLELK